MTVKNSSFYSNDISSPGYIESTASSTRKSKEKLRVDSLIPSEILENSAGIKQLLEAYYTFMNLDEFIYAENENFQDVVLDGKAVFRISDPKNENDAFFTDEQGADSTMTVTNAAGTVTTISLNDVNVNISNGNELPGSLALETSEIGKTFQVLGLAAHNASTAKLNTPIKHWVGPGPSHVLNNIERAMDIDNNSAQFLELMQKEIASVIPRNITVNKRNLYKNIVDYYKIRGSADSIEVFFRLLFDDEVEVQYPWDKTLIPSSGNWDVNAALPRGGQYLDNKGQLSNVIKIQDSLRYQKFSYLIRTGQNVSTWENVFNRLVHPAGFKFFGEILIIIELSKAILGEDVTEGDTLFRKVLSAMPERQPGAIGIEDLPLLVEAFASVFLPSIQSKIHRSGTISVPISKITNGVVTSVSVIQGGSGYIVKPTISFNGSDDEVSGTGIVNITDDTIKLTSAQQLLLPVNTRVTYNSGGGTSIGALVSGTQYFIKTSTGGKVSLSNTSGGNKIDITSVGTGTSHSFIESIITSSDTGTPSGFTAGTFVPTVAAGAVTGISITSGGKDYNTPAMVAAAPAAIVFDGSDDEVAGTGIVNITDNTIKLTSAQAAALPVNSQVVYSSGGGTSISGLTSGGTVFIKTNTSNEVTLSATQGGAVINIAGVGSGTSHSFTGQTATFTPAKTDGIITGLEISDPGFGYSSAPAITFNGVAISGQTIGTPNISIGIDAQGRLDVDNITITSGGSNFAQVFGFVAANSNSGSLAAIDIAGAADKNYASVPTIVIAEPTAKDAAGVLLSSNVQAVATFTLNSDKEINGYNITTAGSGYTRNPNVRIDSNANNEIRAKNIEPILILLLNHLSDRSKTQPQNNYFNRKGNTYLNSAKRYGYNETLKTLSSVQINSTDTTIINNSNVNSFIHTN